MSRSGTLQYMAPEVIDKGMNGYGMKADIWSFGCVLIECATGKPPFIELGSGQAAMFRVGYYKQHPDIPEHLSSDCKNFTLRCFEADPTLRASAVELLGHRFLEPIRMRRQTHRSAERRSSGARSRHSGDDSASAFSQPQPRSPPQAHAHAHPSQSRTSSETRAGDADTGDEVAPSLSPTPRPHLIIPSRASPTASGGDTHQSQEDAHSLHSTNVPRARSFTSQRTATATTSTGTLLSPDSAMDTVPMFGDAPRFSSTAASASPLVHPSRGGAPSPSAAQQHMPMPFPLTALQASTGSLVDLNRHVQSPPRVDTSRDNAALRLVGQPLCSAAFGSHADIASIARSGGILRSPSPSPSRSGDSLGNNNNTLSPLAPPASGQRPPVSRSTSHSAVQVQQAPALSPAVSSCFTAPPGSGGQFKLFSTMSGSASAVGVASMAVPGTPTAAPSGLSHAHASNAALSSVSSFGGGGAIPPTPATPAGAPATGFYNLRKDSERRLTLANELQQHAESIARYWLDELNQSCAAPTKLDAVRLFVHNTLYCTLHYPYTRTMRVRLEYCMSTSTITVLVRCRLY